MKYTYFCLGLLLAGCAKPNCCTVIDTNILIHYADAQGRDWLRTTKTSPENMEVYSLQNGQKQRIFNGNYDAPKGIRLVREADTTKTDLVLYPVFGSSEEAVTLLEFADHRVDTVRCRFNLAAGNVVCTEVRYNGQLRWGSQMSQPGNGRYFTVVK